MSVHKIMVSRKNKQDIFGITLLSRIIILTYLQIRHFFFQSKKYWYFSCISRKRLCCGYSLEAPQRGASNEYPQHMFLWRNKKDIHLILPVINSYGLKANLNTNHMFIFDKYESFYSVSYGSAWTTQYHVLFSFWIYITFHIYTYRNYPKNLSF